MPVDQWCSTNALQCNHLYIQVLFINHFLIKYMTENTHHGHAFFLLKMIYEQDWDIWKTAVQWIFVGTLVHCPIDRTAVAFQLPGPQCIPDVPDAGCEVSGDPSAEHYVTSCRSSQGVLWLTCNSNSQDIMQWALSVEHKIQENEYPYPKKFYWQSKNTSTCNCLIDICTDKEVKHITSTARHMTYSAQQRNPPLKQSYNVRLLSF